MYDVKTLRGIHIGISRLASRLAYVSSALCRISVLRHFLQKFCRFVVLVIVF